MKRIKPNRTYQHVPRQLADGRWVCKGGPTQERCDFSSPQYHEAVTHATRHGGTPPDPKEAWA